MTRCEPSSPGGPDAPLAPLLPTLPPVPSIPDVLGPLLPSTAVPALSPGRTFGLPPQAASAMTVAINNTIAVLRISLDLRGRNGHLTHCTGTHRVCGRDQFLKGPQTGS